MISRTPRILARAVSIATLLTFALPAWSGAQNARGTLVLLGGEPGGDAVNTRFVQLARAAGKGPIVILPMASTNVAEAAGLRERMFRALGAETVTLDITRENAGRDSVARILGAASGIWFTGGSQTRLTAAILGTRALDSVRARYLGGAVVGGSSAGVMAMSDSMFTSEERRPGARWRTTDTSSVEPNSTIERDNVLVALGFGLLRGAIIYPDFIRGSDTTAYSVAYSSTRRRSALELTNRRPLWCCRVESGRSLANRRCRSTMPEAQKRRAEVYLVLETCDCTC